MLEFNHKLIPTKIAKVERKFPLDLSFPALFRLQLAVALSLAVLLIVESCFQNLLKTGIIPALKALL